MTPQVRVKAKPLCPKSVKFAGRIPNSSSKENNFIPIASATKAFATKKAVKPTKILVGLSFKILWIIRRKYLQKEKIKLNQ
jgi:hypothetical protein